MDNFELRFWLETWAEEQEKILAIKRNYSKALIEITVTKTLLERLKAKDSRNELSAQEKPLLAKTEERIVDAERYFGKMEREYQLRHLDLLIIEEKIKIIEEKIGSTEMLAQEKEGLMKNLFANRK